MEVRCETSSGRSMTAAEVKIRLSIETDLLGGWGHQRLEEERRRQEQDRLRSQLQFDTYASTMGGLGMAGADVPRGEGPLGDRRKRDRSEDEENERREDDDAKRFRGDRDGE